MKKIGLIDFYISEWHANNYPNWIRKVCEEKGFDYDVCYAWAEKDVSDVDGKTTDEWCKEYGVERCNTIEELCEKSDNIIILSPSNPEKHLAYTTEAFKCSKRIYVDKTFAPDLETALKIFDISKKYNTPFFTTSALRYADEITEYIGSDNVAVKGGGGSIEEYIIHQLEMLVKIIGVGADGIVAKTEGEETVFDITYPDNRVAQMRFKNENEFAVSVKNSSGEIESIQITSPYFMTLMFKILNFFENGETDFDCNQTVEIMKLRENAIKAKNNLGEFIKL